MEIFFTSIRPVSITNTNRPFKSRAGSLLYGLNNSRSASRSFKNAESLLNKINNDGYTQIGDSFLLNDRTPFDVKDVPRININSLHEAAAKENVMDFGSNCYFKYTNSAGKSYALFSMQGGAISRPMSEYLIGTPSFDLETERYTNFWNILRSGHAMMLPPNNNLSPRFGYSQRDICSYLDEAGISKGFFAVKMGSRKSEFFYSDSKQYPIYTKEDYDHRFYTMTSSDFSYDKSVFSCLEPGTEITISGKKYALKDDLTLDITYGTDIFDIQTPKHTHTSKIHPSIDCKA